MAKNPLFSSAKDFIMQGLSYRLNPFEKISEADLKEKYQIELKPRASYADKVLKPRDEKELDKSLDKSVERDNSRNQQTSSKLQKSQQDVNSSKDVITYQSEQDVV